MTSSKPNILFLMTDQQFGDAMSCRMGNQFIHTPNMDKLAEQGTLFSRAYCPHPLCVPCRSSMITGRYPHELGIMELDAYGKVGGEHPQPVDTHRFPTLATHFRNHGYETGYLGKWHIPLGLDNRDTSGFDFS